MRTSKTNCNETDCCEIEERLVVEIQTGLAPLVASPVILSQAREGNPTFHLPFFTVGPTIIIMQVLYKFTHN